MQQMKNCKIMLEKNLFWFMYFKTVFPAGFMSQLSTIIYGIRI